MNFEDLKDQILERLREIWGKIQESDTFILLRERFETLPQNYQKGIIIGVSVVTAYVIYSIPAGYMSSAASLEDNFQESRDLTRELIESSAMSRSISLPPIPPTGSALTSTVENTIRGQRVMAEQQKTVTFKEGVVGKGLVPSKINSEGAVAKLSKLNLRQVVQAAEDLNNLRGIKLMNMFIQADKEDPHYFNVDYEVAAFSVDIKGPEAPSGDDEDDKKKKKKKRKKKRK